MTCTVLGWCFFGSVLLAAILICWVVELKGTLKANALLLAEAASSFEVAKAKSQRDALTIANLQEAERLAVVAKAISAPHVRRKLKGEKP